MMKEIYKTIDDYPNYEVSNLGNVKSLNWKRTGKEKVLIPIKHKKGYLYVGLYRDGNLKMIKIHRLVANAFIPNIENKPQVNHIDGCKSNNCVENLEWCDNSENQLHSFRHGLNFHSEKSGRPKHKVRCIETQQEFESISMASRCLGCTCISIQRSIHKGGKVLKKYHFEKV